jgi:hypothetical protein
MRASGGPKTAGEHLRAAGTFIGKMLWAGAALAFLSAEFNFPRGSYEFWRHLVARPIALIFVVLVFPFEIIAMVIILPLVALLNLFYSGPAYGGPLHRWAELFWWVLHHLAHL